MRRTPRKMFGLRLIQNFVNFMNFGKGRKPAKGLKEESP